MDMAKQLGSFRNCANAANMAEIYKYQVLDFCEPMVTIGTTLFKIKKLGLFLVIYRYRYRYR